MTASDLRHKPRLHPLARQPALSAAQPDRAVLGRQRHRRPLRGGAYSPVTLSFLRWSGAFLIVLPFAWSHLVRDWPAIRERLGMMILLSVTGIGGFNTLQYWALEHTQALNTLLLQSAGPLFVAIWSLALLGIRLTLAQACGIALSLCGVLVILLHGDLTTLEEHRIQQGRPHLHRGAGDFRAVFGADAEAAQHPRPVVRRLHLRRRCGVPDPAVDLGTVVAPADAARRRQSGCRWSMSRCFPRRWRISASIAACS